MSVSRAELLELAEDALDVGDLETALAFCERILASDPQQVPARLLQAEALRELGDVEGAEQSYRQVTAAHPHESVAFSGLGAVLFDQLRLNDAQAALFRAIREDDGNPEAYYWRAMLRERRGDDDGARRDYRRARNLDPDRYPMPIPLDDALIEGVVTDVLLSMHPATREYLSQVVILLEEVPSDEVCLSFSPPAPPGEILGTFSGSSLTTRSVIDPWSSLPSSIVLFRKNLERIAWSRERLLEELRITVFHEVGHFLGLDEDDLEARGLD